MTRAAPRRWSTKELMTRLERHYLVPEMFPSGDFASEVGINGNYGTGRRCDALYCGYIAARGHILVGHEVKTSRGDWNAERDDPHKSSTWADACHAWYIVAPDSTVVDPNELPPRWGLMIPDPRAKTKMKVVVTAAVKGPEFDPPWWAARSFLHRLAVQRNHAIDLRMTREKGRIEKAAVEDYRRQQRILGTGIGGEAAMTPEQAADHRIMDAFRAEGVQLAVWRNKDTDDILIPTDLTREVRAIVRAGATAAEVRDRVLGRYHNLPRIVTELTALAADIEAMGATNGRP